MLILVTAGQILLKAGAPRMETGQGLKTFVISLFRPPLVIGAGLVFSAPVLYFLALRDLSLGQAFAVSALSIVLVPAGARIFLQERITPLQLAAMIMIAGGVVLANL
ncbi:MAG: EamA family transporter [Spirochaetales bacterium]|nr:EamA family transporter [Spirochaetales bacterium]MCF7937272.1 EamA family transporter [Spirochaetales bacterium]